MEEKNIASRPPVEPSGAAGAAEKPASKPKWPIPAIAAGAVVVLVAAGFAGWHAYTARELDAAKTACAEAADTLRGKANDYNALVNGDAKTASETTPKQVRDAKAVDALKAALKATAPEYEGCTADSKDGLDAAAAKLGQQAEWYESHEKTLTGAVKAVETSKLDKTVDDANALLKSSDGQVQDDKTRDALSGAIKARDADQGLQNGERFRRRQEKGRRGGPGAGRSRGTGGRRRTGRAVAGLRRLHGRLLRIHRIHGRQPRGVERRRAACLYPAGCTTAHART